MINLWFITNKINGVNSTTLQNLLGIDAVDYNEHFRKGSADLQKLPDRIKEHFVLGRERIYIPKQSHFLEIENNSQYPLGLILSSSDHPVIEGYQGEFIDLIGSDNDPFLERAFETYKTLARKATERDPNLLIYQVLDSNNQII